ncbi:MAG: ATP-binding cassette domain-containing protein [Bacteroidales bacterium]|nr:ATP-binding cassette domain-containing protein [Bacteroidales bacterium]
MSENIIDAIIKLLAIITDFNRNADFDNIKNTIRHYLEENYDAKTTGNYFEIYTRQIEAYYAEFMNDEKQFRETQKEKIIEICNEISVEYELLERLLIIIQLLEFVKNENTDTSSKIGFIDSVSDYLNIPQEEYDDIKTFIFHGADAVKNKNQACIIDGNETNTYSGIKHIYKYNQVVIIQLYHIRSKNELIFKYSGDRNLYMNGLKMQAGKTYLLAVGSVLKTSRIRPIYYSQIISTFINLEWQEKIYYSAKDIEFKFDDKHYGIHRFNFFDESGKMVGIIGGSGSGKSTLLNVLNGNLRLNSGKITINGYDIHEEKEKLKGLIGYVPQEDLLIEDLTVYENLLYSARLSLANLPEAELKKNLLKLLVDFDLLDVKDLQVGSPLKKIISGGQRKRLNIALELIREPSILFIDEPTSGLSSMDSEKMMTILKRQTNKGKLIISVIHQPSSDIYKLFDRILIIDKGGYIIFNGNPVDAITYFKKEAHFVNAEESECLSCGNIKTEQPLRIIEARKVNPYGRFLKERRVNPEDWYKLYIEGKDQIIAERIKKQEGRKRKLPKTNFRIPNSFKQFIIYIIRDIKAKLTNQQYIIITLLEAPLLAVILGFFTRYNAGSPDNPNAYIFSENVNIPVFLFMSVLVALFLGLIQSSDEILKDRKILKREAFLNLSKLSFINSKIFILFSMSAIQMLVYTLIGNAILEIKGMSFFFWLMLFSTACFANILGLNLSSGIKSAIAIYVLIPLLLIPQILFSGAVVDFKKMPTIGKTSIYTPFIGDLMASRWAYESMTVHMYMKNKYNREFYDIELQRQHYIYLNNYILPEIKHEITSNDKARQGSILNTLYQLNPSFLFESNKNLTDKNEVISAIGQLENQFKTKTAEITVEKEQKIEKLINKPDGKSGLIQLKQNHHNQKLAETVENIYETKRLIKYNNRYFRNDKPVYVLPEHKFLRAHFYAPYKRIFNFYIETYWSNLLIIWLFSSAFYLTLIYDMLKKILRFFSRTIPTRIQF